MVVSVKNISKIVIKFFYKVVTQTTIGGLTIIVRPPNVVCVTTL